MLEKERNGGGGNHPYSQPVAEFAKDADQRGRIESATKNIHSTRLITGIARQICIHI